MNPATERLAVVATQIAAEGPAPPCRKPRLTARLFLYRVTAGHCLSHSPASYLAINGVL